MMATRSFTIQVDLSPRELAVAFCDMNDYEQAEFFNTIGEVVKEWKYPFCVQLESVLLTNQLTPEGSKVMQTIGEYSQ
jgi:hypothetical protein